jgi:hypothetical protein
MLVRWSWYVIDLHWVVWDAVTESCGAHVMISWDGGHVRWCWSSFELGGTTVDVRGGGHETLLVLRVSWRVGFCIYARASHVSFFNSCHDVFSPAVMNGRLASTKWCLEGVWPHAECDHSVGIVLRFLLGLLLISWRSFLINKEKLYPFKKIFCS